MFGVLVALGVIIGDRIVVAQGRRRGLDPQRREVHERAHRHRRVHRRAPGVGDLLLPRAHRRELEGADQPVRGPVVVRRLPRRFPRVPLLHEEGGDPPPRATPIRSRWAWRSAGSSGAPAASPRTITRACASRLVLPGGAIPRGPAPRSRPLRAAVHDRDDGDPVRVQPQAARRPGGSSRSRR